MSAAGHAPSRTLDRLAFFRGLPRTLRVVLRLRSHTTRSARARPRASPFRPRAGGHRARVGTDEASVNENAPASRRSTRPPFLPLFGRHALPALAQAPTFFR